MTTLLYIFGTITVISGFFLAYVIMTAEPYPDELEQEENERLMNLIDKYKKSQE